MRWLAWAILILAAVGADRVLAQHASDRDLLVAWARQEVDRDFEGGWPPFRLTIERAYLPLLGQDELDRLAREVGNRPDHPRRQELRWELDRRAIGKEVTRYVLWWGRDGWRINSDFVGKPESAYFDAGGSPTESWALGPSHVLVGNPRRGFPPQRDPAASRLEAWELLSRITGGGGRAPRSAARRVTMRACRSRPSTVARSW